MKVSVNLSKADLDAMEKVFNIWDVLQKAGISNLIDFRDLYTLSDPKNYDKDGTFKGGYLHNLCSYDGKSFHFTGEDF